MNIRHLLVSGLFSIVVILIGCASQAQTSNASSAPPPDASAQPAPPNLDPWPRSFTLADATLRVYQPQVEKWEGNRLDFRAAVEATPSGGGTGSFGVIWGTARTEVNRAARLVTLEDLQLTRSNFPTLTDNGAAYRNALAQQFSGVARTIALDRLQASLAASGTVHAAGVPVRNDPPRIIVSNSPAILIPVSGQPVVKEVPDSRFERVINTRALILRTRLDNTWYLHVYDGWLSASSIMGPWSLAADTPFHIGDVADKLAKNGEADLLDGGAAQPKPALANGVPTIYVSEISAELIVFKGQPNFQPVSNTGLLWATNTTADVFVDTSNNLFYALISGRWFSTPDLNNGPWRYVASNALPSDFKRIPADSKAGVVLASVTGTPQAKEALIANTDSPDGEREAGGRTRLHARDRRLAAVAFHRGHVAAVCVQFRDADHPGPRRQALCAERRGMVHGRPARRTVVGRHLGARGDLHHPAQFGAVLHHLRACLRLDARGGLRRLHARLPRHGGRAGRRGRLRHGL